MTEIDVANSLTGYYGVKNIAMGEGEAVIEFDKPWQTAEPIKNGLLIRNNVGNRSNDVIYS